MTGRVNRSPKFTCREPGAAQHNKLSFWLGIFCNIVDFIKPAFIRSLELSLNNNNTVCHVRK
jgi:hypothetical protein